jgi:hypothetical protein
MIHNCTTCDLLFPSMEGHRSLVHLSARLGGMFDVSSRQHYCFGTVDSSTVYPDIYFLSFGT